MSQSYISRKQHFFFRQEVKIRLRGQRTSSIAAVDEAIHIDIISAPRIGRPVSIAAVLQEDTRPYWMRMGISKVFGASPAIVFAPPGPMASIRRVARKAPSVKQRAAWDRFSAMQNGAGDQKDGYDHGECERETRGIHI